MARTMRGCLTDWSQPEGAEEPEINISVSQQEEQLDVTEGKVIAEYGPAVDYEETEPKIEPNAQEKRRKTLMQSMQLWRYFAIRHSARG